MGVLLGPRFRYAVFGIFFSFAIIPLEKKEQVALNTFISPGCHVPSIVICLFLTVSWVGLQCVIVAFPGHTMQHFKIIHGHMPLMGRLDEADVTSLRTQSF